LQYNHSERPLVDVASTPTSYSRSFFFASQNPLFL
jgi:hypothetical protein